MLTGICLARPRPFMPSALRRAGKATGALSAGVHVENVGAVQRACCGVDAPVLHPRACLRPGSNSARQPSVSASACASRLDRPVAGVFTQYGAPRGPRGSPHRAAPLGPVCTAASRLSGAPGQTGSQVAVARPSHRVLSISPLPDLYRFVSGTGNQRTPKCFGWLAARGAGTATGLQ